MKKITGYKKNGNNNNDLSDDFHFICLITDIALGKSRTLSVSDRKGTKIEIAVFNIDGKYYAISNTCKHEGGPLGQGILREKIVTCPWHGWKYSVIDGKAPHTGGDSVDSYETKVINEKLYVNLIPKNLGKRVTEPHESYTHLKNAVNGYLHHMNNDARVDMDVDKKINGYIYYEFE
jgi:nitrite reductase/ring-hydroxylating ferredoxin subunit